MASEEVENVTQHDAVEGGPADLHDMVHHPKGWMNWRVVMNMIIVGLGLCLWGFDNSSTGPILALPLFVLKFQGYGPAFTAKNLDLLVPVPIVGAALGTVASAPLMNKLGRKRAMVLAYFLGAAPGSFLSMFAPNMAAQIVGRFWTNLGVSVLTTAAPLYLTELAPAHFRARAVGFCVAGVAAVGVISTTIIWKTATIADNLQWKIPIALQAAIPVALGFLTLLCTESPLWYLQHDQLERAKSALLSIRNANVEVVEVELATMQAAALAEAERARQADVHFWDILKPRHIQRTLSAGALLCLGQVCGQILIMTYSTVILVQSGVADPFKITILITCLQFLGTIIGPVLVDKVGRRPVALVGFSILFILNMAAGGLAASGLTTKTQQLGLAAVFIIFGFFNSACGQTLSFILPTEISTPSLREPTMAWAVFWSYTTAIITTFAVPQITAADAGNLGAKAAFVFGGCVFITVTWAYFFVPETRARTAAEIDEMYDIGLPMRHWRNHKCQTGSYMLNTGIGGKDFEVKEP
ncbi:hypothetical protein LTS17_001703 [Exophiala oligosperma]